MDGLLRVGHRRVALPRVGLAPALRPLAGDPLPVALALAVLTSAADDLRQDDLEVVNSPAGKRDRAGDPHPANWETFSTWVDLVHDPPSAPAPEAQQVTF